MQIRRDFRREACVCSPSLAGRAFVFGGSFLGQCPILHTGATQHAAQMPTFKAFTLHIKITFNVSDVQINTQMQVNNVLTRSPYLPVPKAHSGSAGRGAAVAGVLPEGRP